MHWRNRISVKYKSNYDAKWGGGFLNPDRWVQIVYFATQKLIAR
jgi:hypothetical protein